MRTSHWTVLDCCTSCKGVLTYNQVMYSRGCCPLCGHMGPAACTIVATTSRAVRFIRTAPWWKFWGDVGYLEDIDSKRVG